MRKTCSQPGCDDPIASRKNLLCSFHHGRKKKGIPLDRPRLGSVPVEERFWNFVDKRGEDECWEWTGFRMKGKWEYGLFSYRIPEKKQKTVRASRFAYTLHHGKEPEKNILHHCDNPPCCNPNHLYDGTLSDNMKDKEERGRHGRDSLGYRNRVIPLGEHNGKSKLNSEKVRGIRRLYATGEYTHSQLSEIYGIEQSSIGRVIRRDTWKHVE